MLAVAGAVIICLGEFLDALAGESDGLDVLAPAGGEDGGDLLIGHGQRESAPLTPSRFRSPESSIRYHLFIEMSAMSAPLASAKQMPTSLEQCLVSIFCVTVV